MTPQMREIYTDPRDGKTYETVRMLDGNYWFAENLDYEVELSHENKEQRGRYYHGQVVPNVAPPGWIVPSAKDWMRMFDSHGNIQSRLQEAGLNIQFFGGMSHGGKIWTGQGIFWTSSVPKKWLGGTSDSRDMVMFIDGNFSVTSDHEYFHCPVRCIKAAAAK